MFHLFRRPYPMAEVDQTYSELEQEYLSEAGVKLEHEVEPKPELVPEPAHGLLQADEHEEKDHKTVDGIEENSHHHDEEQDHVVEPVTGGADKWPGWPGENIYRILVSAQKVGGIIGRKGEYIKKTCEETKARIKVLDGPPGTRERAVMISGKEDPDNPLPPAINGLLSVHKRVLDGLDSDSSTGGKVATRLLLPAAQAGSLIGKQGSTVKSVQDESNCIVRVLSEEDLPVFALQDDRVVEVVGEPADIHKAIELIASHLRKFLVDRSIIPIIEMQMQMPNPPQMEHMPPPAQHWGPPPPPQSFAQSGGHPGPGYGGPNPHFMPPPPRQFDNYYPPPDMPPPLPEKQPHQGISAFGRELPMPVHSSSAQPTSSIITQVTQQMQIPLSYADAVIGTQGSTISYIRRVSGATVTIQESRGAPTEMTVEISGSASQVQTAQQLIQNFMSGAAGQTNAPPPGEQQYNSYGYTSAAPSSQSQGGGYAGQGYGTNYGY